MIFAPMAAIRAFSGCSFRLLDRMVSNCKKTSVWGGSLLRRRFHDSLATMRERKEVNVTFVFPDGKRVPARGKAGDNLLDIVVQEEVDIDGFGACEGTLACSTCHLIFSPEDYSRIPDAPTDEELDMLDLAYGLTDTSRLGCQVCINEDISGIDVQVPEGINDQR